MWGCPANAALDGAVLDRGILVRARQQRELFPCFWTRGLVPMRWTFGKISSPAATPTINFTGDAAADKLLVLTAGDRAATDGSG
eukprot:10519618-Prorocentrum_lima.AAC.1